MDSWLANGFFQVANQGTATKLIGMAKKTKYDFCEMDDRRAPVNLHNF